jgi:hypothetical protein
VACGCAAIAAARADGVKQANPPAAGAPAPPAAKSPTSAPATVTLEQPGAPAPTVQLKPGEVPVMKFDAVEFEFPRTPAGRDVFHDFTFTNTGNGALEVVLVRPSCGCTTTGGYEKIVPPGGKGRIPIKVATNNLAGRISKTIAVITNAPQPNTSVQLTVKGEVWEPLTVSPGKTIGFGRVSMQDPAATSAVKKVKIVNNAPTPANLGNVRCEVQTFKGEVKVMAPGKEFEFEVRLAPPFQGGVVNSNFEIETGLAEMPKMTLPVSVYLAGDIEVFPNRLPLPPQRAKDLERQFSIVNNTTKPLKLLEATCTNSALKPRIEETRPGMAFKVLVNIPKSYAVSRGGDLISVKTDNPTTPNVAILITEARNTGPSSGSVVDIGSRPFNDPAASAIPTDSPR